MNVPTLEGITAKTVTTDRLSTRVLFSGPEGGVPVLFIHGNASSATYWEEPMLDLPGGFRSIAHDQRGYGGANRDKLVDGERGLGDWSEDVLALIDHLGMGKLHVVGCSLGGAVIWRMMMDYPERLLTVTMISPGSPYGFGGTKGVEGTPCYDDFAGSGGGVVNPEFPKLIAAGDRSSDNPQASPRVVMNSFYWKPPFIPEREEDYLSSILTQHIGEDAYPGDFVPSENWPNVAPGRWGPINAVSPKYLKPIDGLYTTAYKPPVLWVRGSDDQIVSDLSLFDFGTLGAMDLVPGWPGVDIYPSQPMVSQTRGVLEKYAAAGGEFKGVVLEDTAHTPNLEKPEEFNQVFHAHIG
jgi:pimeloyl-ACP methyl ester carboxylesterase